MSQPTPDTRRSERRIALSFGISMVSGFALLGVYLAGGQTQIEAVLLAISLGGIGAGIIVWSQRLLPNDLHVEPRHAAADPASTAVRDIVAEERAITRRSLLIRALGGAFAGLAAALAIPVLSLGPAPGRSLFQTPWRRGLRMVGLDGQPIKASDVPVGGIVTGFPEGVPGSADGQTLLIRVEPGLLRLAPDRMAWAPDGYVAYSKLCTHAGCPVGLYRNVEHRLICPCHQSTFDVLDGAQPVFGPASRPLPQLPIQIEADGTIVALGDFTETVGPGFWNMHDG
ncbi:MAG: Rieske 2Fe-2S domain-containing protein [Candidatus Limnocylindrales bacterium]